MLWSMHVNMYACVSQYVCMNMSANSSHSAANWHTVALPADMPWTGVSDTCTKTCICTDTICIYKYSATWLYRVVPFTSALTVLVAYVAEENNRQIWMLEPGQQEFTWHRVSARLDQHGIPGYQYLLTHLRRLRRVPALSGQKRRDLVVIGNLQYIILKQTSCVFL